MASKSSKRRGGVTTVETWTVTRNRKQPMQRPKITVRVPAGGDSSGNRPGTFYGATNFRSAL